jgi:hypothetical protein
MKITEMKSHIFSKTIEEFIEIKNLQLPAKT